MRIQNLVYCVWSNSCAMPCKNLRKLYTIVNVYYLPISGRFTRWFFTNKTLALLEPFPYLFTIFCCRDYELERKMKYHLRKWLCKRFSVPHIKQWRYCVLKQKKNIYDENLLLNVQYQEVTEHYWYFAWLPLIWITASVNLGKDA